MKKSHDKQVVEIEKQKIATQITSEVELLNQFDPDKELKEASETAFITRFEKIFGCRKVILNNYKSILSKES